MSVIFDKLITAANKLKLKKICTFFLLIEHTHLGHGIMELQ